MYSGEGFFNKFINKNKSEITERDLENFGTRLQIELMMKRYSTTDVLEVDQLAWVDSYANKFRSVYSLMTQDSNRNIIEEFKNDPDKIIAEIEAKIYKDEESLVN